MPFSGIPIWVMVLHPLICRVRNLGLLLNSSFCLMHWSKHGPRLYAYVLSVAPFPHPSYAIHLAKTKGTASYTACLLFPAQLFSNASAPLQPLVHTIGQSSSLASVPSEASQSPPGENGNSLVWSSPPSPAPNNPDTFHSVLSSHFSSEPPTQTFFCQ